MLPNIVPFVALLVFPLYLPVAKDSRLTNHFRSSPTRSYSATFSTLHRRPSVLLARFSQGTESTQAGKSSACDGCPNQSFCASDAPKLPDPDLGVIRDRMASVRKKILVLSGKGGVGKSTFSSGLGWALSADEDKQVSVCFRR